MASQRYQSTTFDTLNPKKRRKFAAKQRRTKITMIAHGNTEHPISQMNNCKICRHINKQFSERKSYLCHNNGGPNERNGTL